MFIFSKRYQVGTSCLDHWNIARALELDLELRFEQEPIWIPTMASRENLRGMVHLQYSETVLTMGS